MKIIRFLPLLLISFAIQGCYHVAFVSIKSNVTSPTIDINRLIYDSPPRFIDRTLEKMPLPEGILSEIGYNDKIMLVCLNHENPEVVGARSATNRAFISKLLSRRIRVIDPSNRLIKETLARAIANKDSVTPYHLTSTGDLPKAYERSGSVLQPTKILAYRILDLGITQSINQANDDVYRFGVAELDLRLTDASTTQVLYSGIVTNVTEDTLTNSEYVLLSRMHFRYYPDDMLAGSNPTSLEAHQNFLAGQGFAVGTITFNFTEGAQEAYAYLRDAATNALVKKIGIPGDNPGSIFSYTWNLTNEQAQRINPGDYALWLSGREVHILRIGD